MKSVWVALVALVVLGAVGCGSTRTGTALTLTATNRSVGTATFHLRCNPAGGDISRPLRACAALESDPELLVHPKPFACWGGTFSWWDITISGRFHGKPVSVKTSSCWTRQMKLIDSLGLGDDQLQMHTAPPAETVMNASAWLGAAGGT